MAEYLKGRVCLHAGDCLDVMRTLADNSIDAVVTDPPYGIRFMGKAWDGADIDARLHSARQEARDNRAVQYGGASRTIGGAAASAGAYDLTPKGMRAFQEFTLEYARECLRVLKPGGHCVVFGGTRTYHRMACAIEDAGFEIRDQLAWCYGSGFPKSLDVSKAIDKAAGAEREVVGEKRAGLARKARAGGEMCGGEPSFEELRRADITIPATASARQWEGWGTALKPAWEPICLARKPLSEKTVAANILRWGTGAINVDGCRIDVDPDDQNHRPGITTTTSARSSMFGIASQRRGSIGLGRFPANLCHDGSQEVLALFPNAGGGFGTENRKDGTGIYGKFSGETKGKTVGFGDSGSAARFFYTAKADADNRLGSKHPTVKPLDLMQWLVRLVTSWNGTVLDPFAGTGTTGEAAWRENAKAILIEREAGYLADIERRMQHALASPRERVETILKARGLVEDAGPLFGNP